MSLLGLNLKTVNKNCQPVVDLVYVELSYINTSKSINKFQVSMKLVLMFFSDFHQNELIERNSLEGNSSTDSHTENLENKDGK